MEHGGRRIAFIGIGRVGQTLAAAMHAAGEVVVALHSRDSSRAEAVAAATGARAYPTAQEAASSSDVVFLTVPDDAIGEVCATLRWRPDQAVVHCSGATELTALAAAARDGASCGGFHPLQMFADPAVALATLPGCTITIEAAGALDAVLIDLCRRLDCRPLRLAPGQRALYHASAYYVGPFAIALMQEAVRIWATLGFAERDAMAALVPLLRGTVAAALEQGLAGGMGGCVARGDGGTLARHLAALETFSPEMASLYRALARRTVPLARARGTLSEAAADRIHGLLDAPPPPGTSTVAAHEPQAEGRSN